jgi:hypothetical protein
MMARDDDPWRRQREREEERERELQQEAQNKTGKPELTRNLRPDQLLREAKGGSSEKLQELLDRGTPMIEQLNNLYNMYFSGAEKRPPIERREQLDQIAQMVLLMPKPTQGLQFRSTTFLSSYQSFVDRWERMLKSFEKTGKRF